MAVVLDAPVLFQLTPGSGSVTLDFLLPLDSPFTDVLYATNGGAFLSLGATGGQVTITKESDNTTNLVNGTLYIIQLVGISIDYPLTDESLRSPPQIFTPVGAATLPDAPIITSCFPGDASVSLTYLLGENGGSTVTAVYYTTDSAGMYYTLLPGSLSGSATITTKSNGNPIINNEQLIINLVSVNAVQPLPQNNLLSNPVFVIPAASSTPASTPYVTGHTPGNNKLDVTYYLGSNGGSNFISVYYSTDDGSTWASSGATSGLAQILNKSDGSGALVNGNTYQVRLLVTTIDYPDPNPSINLPSERVDMTPASGTVPPDPPSIGAYIPGDKTLTVSYTLGSDGGSPVTKVYYSTDNGTTWYDTGSVSGTAIITALSTDGSTLLTNDTAYPVQLVAVTVDFNDETTNTASNPPVIMIPFASIVRPDVVSIDTVEAGDGFVGVSYSIVSTGGSQLTNIYYSTDGGNSWKNSGSTNGFLVITQQSGGEFALENGTTYYLLLVAATEQFPDYLNNPFPNSATPATPLAPETPPSPPDAPLVDSANVGDKTITLSYKVGLDGGSAFTDVLYTTDGGDSWYSTGETYPFGEAIITALSTDGTTLLSNGTDYYVQLVSLTEAFPTSTNPRSILQILTPTATPVAPDAPNITTSFAGNATVQIDYSFGSVGGSYVTDVQYTTDGGTSWLTTGNTTGTAVITTDSLGAPLVNGTPYIFNLVVITELFSDPTVNPPSVNVTITPTTESSVPPDAPIIISNTPGDGQLEVFFTVDSPGSGTLLSVWYSTDGAVWIDSGVAIGSFIMTTDSNNTPLVNGQAYNVRIVAVTSDYDVAQVNTPSEIVSMTPLAVPVAPDAPLIMSFSPGDQSVSLIYKLGSNGGSFFTNVWYTTNNGGDWMVLPVGSSIDTSTDGMISFLSSDGVTSLTNGVEYTIRLMTTTAAFPTPTNTPSEPVYATPSATSQRPSAPVITSWAGTEGTLTVRYIIPSDGGSAVTAVYYSTDSGLSWATTRSPNGTAVITMTSDGVEPIIDSTTYGIRLVAITVDFPSLANPASFVVYMVARPTLAGTFKPKGMSYTEFLRSKKADRVKIINTKHVRTASEITNTRRLAASTVFALNNEAVKGSITTPIDFSQGGLHAARSYYKEGGAGRRVGSASEFTAFSGSQAIGGLVQSGLPPTRIVQPSNFILVSRPVAQSAGDHLRRDQGVRVSLGQQHDLTEVTPPKFVDNTIRNTGSPATVTRPAIHDIKAKNAFAYVPNRPSQAGGQYALKGDLEPGKDLGAVGGNPHYKAGAALKNIPYVEKHHGNDLGVNPKRPFVRYQIPKGATPVHLKINKPVNTV